MQTVQNPIDNTNHTLRTGVSYVFDNFDESYNQNQFLLKESIPGVLVNTPLNIWKNLIW